MNAGEDLQALTKALASDKSLSPADRNASLNIVFEESDRRATTAQALDHAEQAATLLPDNPNIINTLGVAQYRAGKYAEAITTLARSTAISAKLGKPQPSDLAFTAMARSKFGQDDEARAVLATLRALMSQPLHTKNPESQGFLREAEQLIEPRRGDGK